MVELKQHHYAHASYLENFRANDQKLHVFDKWSPGRQFATSPDKILRQGYYYSQPVHSEGRFDIGLEKFFSNIESNWPSLIGSISVKQKLTDETYSSFCEMICTLRARVPNTRKALEVCLQDTARKLMREADEPVPDEIARLFSTKNSRIARLQSEGALRLHHLVDEKLIVVPIDPHHSLSFMPQIVQSMKPYLGRFFRKSFLHNKTKIDFITSDNPIVFFNRVGKADPKPFCQDADGNFQFIFPITRRIVFYHNTKEQVIDDHRHVRSEKTVNNINRLVAQFADRYIYIRKFSERPKTS